MHKKRNFVVLDLRRQPRFRLEFQRDLEDKQCAEGVSADLRVRSVTVKVTTKVTRV